MQDFSESPDFERGYEIRSVLHLDRFGNVSRVVAGRRFLQNVLPRCITIDIVGDHIVFLSRKKCILACCFSPTFLAQLDDCLTARKTTRDVQHKRS